MFNRLLTIEQTPVFILLSINYLSIYFSKHTRRYFLYEWRRLPVRGDLKPSLVTITVCGTSFIGNVMHDWPHILSHIQS